MDKQRGEGRGPASVRACVFVQGGSVVIWEHILTTETNTEKALEGRLPPAAVYLAQGNGCWPGVCVLERPTGTAISLMNGPMGTLR